VIGPPDKVGGGRGRFVVAFCKEVDSVQLETHEMWKLTLGDGKTNSALTGQVPNP